jgi:glucose/arabinose dehydrogenase
MRGGRQRARTIIGIPLILLIILGLRPLVQSNNGGIGKFLNGVFGEQVVPWNAVNAFSEKLPLPLWVIPKVDSSGYLYTDRRGQIWEIDSARNNPEPRLLLDISEQVYASGDGGLMDIAYHPEFGVQDSPNGQFIYANYIYIPPELKSQNPEQLAYHRLSRFTVQESGLINPASELVLIQMFDRNHLHSGGSIFFDNEGFLNVSVGDEGKHNDLFFNANTLEKRLFAGIIRIDVDMDPAKSHPPRRRPIDVERPEGWPADFYENYFIPNTNPWLSPSGEFLEEFVIVGLRNPHTTCYDAMKDEIWVADVGEATREEISLMKRGDNGQWPFMEGTIPGPRERPAEIFGTERPPIHDFGRDIGRSVIGGFVYRGEHESLNEHFISMA